MGWPKEWKKSIGSKVSCKICFSSDDDSDFAGLIAKSSAKYRLIILRWYMNLPDKLSQALE